MNIKRFFGRNSREALNQVRLALGEHAVILSNRSVDGGNEIMAVAESEIDAATTSPQPAAAMMQASQAAPAQPNTAAQASDAPTNFDEAPTLLSVLKGEQAQTSMPSIDGLNMATSAPTPAATAQDTSSEAAPSASGNSHFDDLAMPDAVPQMRAMPNGENDSALSSHMASLLDEVRDMRSQVNAQFMAMHWNNQLQSDPIKSKAISALLSAKYSAALSRKITDKLPKNLDHVGAMSWVKEVLNNNLQAIDDEEALFNKGGVYAIVGPTGVGKTTTTAKIAARYVMQHGTQSLGLITTDGYRVGGHEQLRTYGKILGVMVHAVKDEADLKIALNELKSKRMILIDTVGISQRDRMVTEQIAMLSNVGTPIKKLLCLNATCTGDTLSDVIQIYKARAMDGCIITKLDEAASTGSVLDVIVREKAKLYYTTHGQRVPEDIHLADKDTLVNQSLTMNSNSWAFQYLEEELPFVIAEQALSHQEKHHA